MLAIGFIDCQADFMLKSGALYVPGAESLIDRIAKLYESTHHLGCEVFFTADDHDGTEPELQRNGGVFPDHCMRGTPGQQIVVDTTKDVDSPVFTKHGYDVFDSALGNPYIRGWLKDRDIDRVVLVGIALDYCVRAAAVGLDDLGIPTVVASDLTKGIADDTIKDTLMEFHRRGIGYAPTWTFSISKTVAIV